MYVYLEKYKIPRKMQEPNQNQHFMVLTAEDMATQALQKSNWNESEKYFCEVIRLDNSKSDAWLGKLFCHFKVRSIDELRTLPKYNTNLNIYNC